MDRKEIAEGLKSLGLKKGSIVMLHSSYLSLGEVEGGPSEVIKAFLDVIGRKGTLLVPAFGKLGVLVEEVKNLPGAIVSTCPVGAVAAYGPAAEELCKDHWKAETATVTALPPSVMSPWSKDAKPAVLVLTDWKKPFNIFSPTGIWPSVPGLFHSSAQINTPPPKIRTNDVSSTNLEYTLSFLKERTRAISSQTKKPRPPKTISAIKVRQTTGSPENTIILAPGSRLPRISKPALQNAETE